MVFSLFSHTKTHTEIKFSKMKITNYFLLTSLNSILSHLEPMGREWKNFLRDQLARIPGDGSDCF